MDISGATAIWNSQSWTVPWGQPELKMKFLYGLEEGVGEPPAFFPFEKGFSSSYSSAIVRQYYWLGGVIAVVYLLFVCTGRRFFRYRKPLEVDRSLLSWNFALFMFSAYGAFRSCTRLFILLGQRGFLFVACSPALFSYGLGPSGFWTTAFIFSKIVELTDTVFVVVRKKNLTFLHWYHHVTVFLYCWDAFVREIPTGIFFISINYIVHTMMYLYFFLSGCNSMSKPKWGIVVTLLQIVQMFIGLGVTLLSLYLSRLFPAPTLWFPHSRAPLSLSDSRGTCVLPSTNPTLGLFMYASYLLLFVRFFVNKHLSKNLTKRAD
eukprot:TRINITY_DN45437_c0_g2_i1.p1 TRINITY_DN45437_c0_g2~~TRINITY_DN45437_c0_g2_i1.p1  ORF type:complete len:320 (+),score=2.28 TRINITY_DN45437_c0_g2_i1:94-1053(+)